MSMPKSEQAIKDIGKIMVKIATRAKDGIDLSDGIALVSDAELIGAFVELGTLFKDVKVEVSAAKPEDEIALLAPIAGVAVDVYKALKA